ncbi:hypothetical protein CHS0354_007829 [Potamilus streckersoni]|uniref:Link domain-containing protein n=1 Tax=Potamilus streckersoni TaxID=2493646 RepID=A0AAE0VXP5_9BIVA|nr:hypothetical protein CHS0354_007829 [Potamilus streckersoni]
MSFFSLSSVCLTNTFRFIQAPTNDIPFSLDGAEKACTEAGTTIASKETIDEAVASGYDECQCGWLSDGTMVSPKPNNVCTKNGGHSTDTCTSSNTFGVYCNNKF